MNGMARLRSGRAVAGDDDSNATRAVTRREFNRLAARIDELSRQVARNRKDIDIQFQRLAQLQAVVDRIQIAAKRPRTRRDGAPD